MKENVMKKLLAMFLVLGMASLANATILDLVPMGVVDESGQPTDRDGSEQNPLLASDVVVLGLRLNENPTPSPGGYPGWGLSSFDLDIHVTGNASLSPDVKTTFYGVNTYIDWQAPSAITMGALLQSDAQHVDQVTGVVTAPQDVPGESIILGGGILLHCDGAGTVTVDLTLHGLTEYSKYISPTGDPLPPESLGGGWFAATEDDLGDLVIYQIPEPITMALLGVGGLLLRRRR
jgi:hypothetical protein